MKKSLNILLLISFVLTVMVPVTGIHIHKLAATVFLLLKYNRYSYSIEKN